MGKGFTLRPLRFPGSPLIPLSQLCCASLMHLTLLFPPPLGGRGKNPGQLRWERGGGGVPNRPPKAPPFSLSLKKREGGRAEPPPLRAGGSPPPFMGVFFDPFGPSCVFFLKRPPRSFGSRRVFEKKAHEGCQINFVRMLRPASPNPGLAGRLRLRSIGRG